MKKLILFLLFFAVLSLSAFLAQSEIFSNNALEEGRNIVRFDKQMYAQDLILLNPEIEYVSYYDDFLGQEFAYVNAFGGIGKNFVIIPGRDYEISVKEKMDLDLGDADEGFFD